MTDDGWLGPDTCGVKLAQFEQMAQQMTRAAPALARLADELWQALNGAGVSTAPAMEVKRIAAWAADAAADLRRRDVLVHDLDRQKLAMSVCRPDGTYLKLPDRYTDQVAYAEGRRATDLLRKAATGDAAAQKALRRMRPEDVTPMFAKALLESLGPEELLKLPMSLTMRLAGDANNDRPALAAHAADTRAILAILGRSLALTTDPARKGYLGDDYLSALRAAGRTTFPPLSVLPKGTAGYQSLATLLGSTGTRFSAHFIDTVGNDMVAYDSGLRPTLGQVPLPDLAGRYGLGNALDPSATDIRTGGRRTDFLAPLLLAAAASGKEASQKLLTHRPMGPLPQDPQPRTSGTNLQYLLHDRRAVWGESDHGTALGKTLEAATTAQDPGSTRLAFAAAQILATDARANFKVKDGKVQVGDKAPLDALLSGAPADAIARPHHYDELSGLRPSMAKVLVAHLDQLHDLVRLSRFDERPGSTGLTADDLDYLLLDVARNATAYETLLMGQIAHAKIAVDRTVQNHGDLSNTIAGEGQMFGHLLEARHQTLGAEGLRLAEDLARMQSYVGHGIALLPVDFAPITRVPIAGDVFNVALGKLSGKLTTVLAKKLADKEDPAIVAPKTDTEGVERLFNQMIISSLVTHGQYVRTGLDGRAFVDEQNRIKPLATMSPSEMEKLIRWANNTMKLNNQSDTVMTAIENGATTTSGHYRGSGGENVSESGRR
ncbi:hypothetical protein [Actinomadura fibrosa]|uniref:Uncharacterized protein n=1 Tax=Actinomadura fibrosa TaxID=111802 RepID=A0ABW2XGQ4_9ACTN|nr:hypothetical protein [Actinomadura fibrosa]